MSIADTGLFYAQDTNDRDCYEELKEICEQLITTIAGKLLEILKNFFLQVTDYPTVTVNAKGIFLNVKNEILMANESVVGKWTIPGRWADIGDSPSEVVIKEIRE